MHLITKLSSRRARVLHPVKSLVDVVGLQGGLHRQAAGALLVDLLLQARSDLQQHPVQAQLLAPALVQVLDDGLQGLQHQLAELLHRQIQRLWVGLAGRLLRRCTVQHRLADAIERLAHRRLRLAPLRQHVLQLRLRRAGAAVPGLLGIGHRAGGGHQVDQLGRHPGGCIGIGAAGGLLALELGLDLGPARLALRIGAAAQLGLFDALPEREQRDLLAAVVAEAAYPERDLSASWRKGDMNAIEAETRSGLLADPELRAVLFTGRNRRWTGRIAQAVRSGSKPFVAVGAAHMAGPEGLPAMLTAEGFTVTRVE